MKSIQRDELYEHLSGFLKGKGIELKEGSYAAGIQKGCTLLADAINLSQKGLSRAKGEIDKKLGQMRQAIHEKTAPKPKAAAQTAKPADAKAKPQAPKAKAKPAKRASVKR
jgi:type IV secretory pathway TrbL component